MMRQTRICLRRHATACVLIVFLLSVAFLGTAAAQEGSSDSPTVYVGDSVQNSGNVYGINASTGTELWSTNTSAGITAPTIVSDGTVFVGDTGGNLYALDASDGSKLWTFETDGGITSSPSVLSGAVYFQDSIGNLHAIDASDGSKIWTFENMANESSYGSTSSPAVTDEKVYFGSQNGKLYALDKSDGSVVWRFETNAPVGSSPTVVSDVVYFGNDNGSMYAVDANEGTELWENTQKFSTGPSSPTVASGTVYVGGMAVSAASEGSLGVGIIRALDTSDGSEVWNATVSEQVRSSPTVTDDTVYFGSQDGNTYALDTSNGSVLWRFGTERGFLSSPTVVDGIAFIGSRWPDNEVHALNADTGEELWSYEAEGVVYSPTVAGTSSGSSVGSRVLHGTLGNHNNMRAGENLISSELGSIDIVSGGAEREEVIETVETQEGEGGGGLTSFLVILVVGAVIAVAAAAVSRRDQD